MQLTNALNLNKFELQNARVQNLAAAPSSPVIGQIYFNTADSRAYVYTGVTNGWVAMDAASPTIADGSITNAKLADNAVTNAKVSASAAIAYSKLALTGAIVNADISTSAAIAYSKLALTGAIVNADVATAAAIAYSKLNLSGSVVNGDISPTAAIALSKLAVDPLARANHTGTQLHSTISDFDAGVQTNRLDQMAAPTSAVDFNGQKITGLGTPTADSDAATKAYVDATASGLDIKASVRAATTANITLSGTQTVDSVVLVAGNRVLVKNQTTTSQNGIYVVNAGAWTRATDADSNTEVTPGMFVFVEEGGQADTGWVLTNDGAITLGTTGLTFTQFSGPGSTVAGNGLARAGNTLSVQLDGSSLSVSASGVRINSTWTGQNTITTLGTITTGVWNGTAIAVANGGTGATTAAAARTNLGATTKFAAAVGDGTNTTFVVTHGLNTRDVIVQVYEASGAFQQVWPDIEATALNDVTLRFGAAPTASQYRVVVIG